MKHRMRYKSYKNYNLYLILLVLIFGITIGYALLFTDLDIQGSAAINSASWDIHFENIQETTGGVVPNSVTSINTAKDTVTFNVDLDTPGQFYEFTVDVVNAGSIGGMIDTFGSTLNGGSINNLPSSMSYSVTYSDGMPIAVNQSLPANSSETYKVRVEFKSSVTIDDLPDSNQTLSFTFSATYVQATSSAIPVYHPNSFTSDSLETIAAAVSAGVTDYYSVGDMKSVSFGSFGTLRVRVANKSTPSECSTPGFSQTACGFVIEFADIIFSRAMGSASSNAGGWESSSLRPYLNTDLYQEFPSAWKNHILNTYAVSGYGNSDSANFITTDKIYLLSSREVWNSFNHDTAALLSRQLDYYNSIGVTSTNYSNAKKRATDYSWWWLRNAYTTTSYATVNPTGIEGGFTSVISSGGVSPAFRLG